MKLLNNGSIRESNSEWAANCSTVRKKDGTVRVVQDFRGINALLKPRIDWLTDLQHIMDEMEGSKYFSSIDLASGFLQLEIHEDDRHLTAFRAADEKLYEYVRCGFGLKTVPSAFANYVGGRLLTAKDRGIKNWLDDVAIPSKTLDDQWGLLRETLECLRQGRLTANLHKSHFCQSVMEFVSMIVDRLGTRPAPSKIDAITQLSRLNTVEEVQVLLGMTGYSRQFVPQYSTVVAPISALLRDPRFRTKRAKKEKVPWGEEQNKAFDALIQALTSPPILALPVWTEPLSLSTDASEMGAGEVLTQCIEGVEKVIAYGSKRWSRGDSKRSATDRECIAVMWALSKFQPYLWGRPFTLITDCSALIWLFKGQSLTPNYHHLALRLMEHKITLKWRPGTQHQLPDAMSLLPNKSIVIEDFDDSFPENESLPNVYQGPQGPVLDGVHLETFRAEDVDGSSTQNYTVLAAVALTP